MSIERLINIGRCRTSGWKAIVSEKRFQRHSEGMVAAFQAFDQQSLHKVRRRWVPGLRLELGNACLQEQAGM
ncbi:MAG: hypothetical protein IPM84_14675 [Anaerolineae bacterium]|nr:hypothetical protein [Anaerolineae bacterium]